MELHICFNSTLVVMVDSSLFIFNSWTHKSTEYLKALEQPLLRTHSSRLLPTPVAYFTKSLHYPELNAFKFPMKLGPMEIVSFDQGLSLSLPLSLFRSAL